MMQVGLYEGKVTKLLTERDVVALYGLNLGTLRNHRSKGIGLPFVRLEGKVRYRLQEVEAYIQNHRVPQTPVNKETIR